MQNTVSKKYADDPRVVTALMSQAESKETLETFWRNVYLRSRMIFDQDGNVARDAYAQPNTGLPFGRSFVIGPDQKVVRPQFGHNPDWIIETIDELLESIPLPGDFDGNGRVDLRDYAVFCDCLAGPGTAPDPTPPVTPQECLDVFDFDEDDDIDLRDFGRFATGFMGG